ncbi:winged helix-turn-helix domain-containing protein [Nocardia sp. NPDC050630]|uniref:winged helix-turn-helix domain-containing protein n=1 Tax=Nocardia sp. NPDC050630 TaxID=3364321 RepID=UPI003795A2A0
MLRDGSISNRDLAERARLDPKTVRASIRRVINAGVLVVRHTYTGGPKDCHAYSIGPAAEPHIAAARAATSPTSCSTPPLRLLRPPRPPLPPRPRTPPLAAPLRTPVNGHRDMAQAQSWWRAVDLESGEW